MGGGCKKWEMLDDSVHFLTQKNISIKNGIFLFKATKKNHQSLNDTK